MLSLPEIRGTNEKRFLYRRRIFPRLPIRPSFTKITRITEHISTVSFVSVLVMSISESEATLVVIVLREDHDIVGSTLPQKKVIGGLDRDLDWTFN